MKKILLFVPLFLSLTIGASQTDLSKGTITNYTGINVTFTIFCPNNSIQQVVPGVNRVWDKKTNPSVAKVTGLCTGDIKHVNVNWDQDTGPMQAIGNFTTNLKSRNWSFMQRNGKYVVVQQ